LRKLLVHVLGDSWKLARLPVARTPSAFVYKCVRAQPERIRRLRRIVRPGFAQSLLEDVHSYRKQLDWPGLDERERRRIENMIEALTLSAEDLLKPARPGRPRRT